MFINQKLLDSLRETFYRYKNTQQLCALHTLGQYEKSIIKLIYLLNFIITDFIEVKVNPTLCKVESINDV